MNTNQRKKRGISFYLKILVSLVLIFYVFYKAGLPELIETLKGTDFFFLGLALSITPVLIFLSSWKWQILLSAQGSRVSLGRLYALYLVGYFFNNVMPSNVGGDIIRAYELGRYTHKEAESFASVFLERFTGLTVLIFLALIAFLIKVGSIGDARLTIVMGIVLAGYIGIFPFILDQRAFNLIYKKARVRILKELMAKLQKVQSALMNYKGKNQALIFAMIISILFYMLAVVNVYLGCLAFGVQVSLAKLFIGVPIIMVISMLPISIGGIGLSEWAYFFIFTTLGITGSLGLSVALLMRAKAVVCGLLGGLFYSSMSGKLTPSNCRS
ncbi:MAG: flippase-like domain-containing protein [Thermoplasmatales archaeon]|nr:flippase-like domain-containing protein [Thermoplasmatales archaeon]